MTQNADERIKTLESIIVDLLVAITKKTPEQTVPVTEFWQGESDEFIDIDGAKFPIERRTNHNGRREILVYFNQHRGAARVFFEEHSDCWDKIADEFLKIKRNQDAYWKEMQRYIDHHPVPDGLIVAIAEHELYIGVEGKHDADRDCLGFAGAELRIEMFDGRVFETNNLYSVNWIPPRFWPIIPDNAKITNDVSAEFKKRKPERIHKRRFQLEAEWKESEARDDPRK